MKAGAVIVTYNNEETLAECIKSIRSNGITDITVVDNASTDTSLQVAKARNVACLAQPENYGFAVAANTGAKRLACDYLLFLNPDAKLAEGTLASAWQYLATHSQVGALGLALYSAQGIREHTSYGSRITPWSLITRHLLPRHFPSQPLRVGWVSAAAMIVNSKALQQIGGFDPQFFLYWEDVDLCQRLQRSNWEVVLLPHACAIHRRGISLPDRIRKTALYDESADKYFRKHYPAVIWRWQRSLRSLYRLFSPRVD